jgi:hypothetical protein
LSVRIDAEVARRVRELCRDQAGAPLYLTLGGFVEAAVIAHLDATEAKLSSVAHARRHPSSNNRS